MQDDVGDGAIINESGDTGQTIEGRILKPCQFCCRDKAMAARERAFERKTGRCQRFTGHNTGGTQPVGGQPKKDGAFGWRVRYLRPVGSPGVNRIYQRKIPKAGLQTQHQIGVTGNEISRQTTGTDAGFAVLHPGQKQSEIKARQIGQCWIDPPNFLASQEGSEGTGISRFGTPLLAMNLPQFSQAVGADYMCNVSKNNHSIDSTR